MLAVKIDWGNQCQYPSESTSTYCEIPVLIIQHYSPLFVSDPCQFQPILIFILERHFVGIMNHNDHGEQLRSIVQMNVVIMVVADDDGNEPAQLATGC